MGDDQLAVGPIKPDGDQVRSPLLARAVEPTSDAQRAMRRRLQTHKDGTFSVHIEVSARNKTLL
jgi:hypothetical protein